MSLDHFAEQRFEPPRRPGLSVNFLPLIATADDMIERTGKVHARASGHDRISHRKYSLSKLAMPDTYTRA